MKNKTRRRRYDRNTLYFYLFSVSGYVRRSPPPDWWGLVIILCLFSSLPETCRSSQWRHPAPVRPAALQSPGRDCWVPGISPGRGVDTGYLRHHHLHHLHHLPHHLHHLHHLLHQHRHQCKMWWWEHERTTEEYCGADRQPCSTCCMIACTVLSSPEGVGISSSPQTAACSLLSPACFLTNGSYLFPRKSPVNLQICRLIGKTNNV